MKQSLVKAVILGNVLLLGSAGYEYLTEPFCQLRLLKVIALVTTLPLFYSLLQYFSCLQVKEDTMFKEVWSLIKDSAYTYMESQSLTILSISLLFMGIILGSYHFASDPLAIGEKRSLIQYEQVDFLLNIALTFSLGVVGSLLSGIIGMYVSVRLNIKVSSCCMESKPTKGLKVGCLGGFIGAAFNVGISILFIEFLYLKHYYFIVASTTAGADTHDLIDSIPILLSSYGFGASFVAIFSQLGGGIFTKAADISADIVGKIDHSAEEDDYRNPAVIADLVGDNVGDLAGQASDLFQSISAEIITVMIISIDFANKMGLSHQDKLKLTFLPLIIHAFDLVVGSAVTACYFRLDERDSKKDVEVLEYFKSGNQLVSVISLFFMILFLRLYLPEVKGYAFFELKMFFCLLLGHLSVWVVMLCTEQYTDSSQGEVRKIIEFSKLSVSSNILSGFKTGMESAALPVAFICVVLTVTYLVGKLSVEGAASDIAGLYATAMAAMGMFIGCVFILTISGFGPISDNSQGIIELSSIDESKKDKIEAAKKSADKFDVAGNVTKANAKGYSVGSAMMACFLMVASYEFEASKYYASGYRVVSNLLEPEVFIGGLLGSMTVFCFSGWSIQAVMNAADVLINKTKVLYKQNIENSKTRQVQNMSKQQKDNQEIKFKQSLTKNSKQIVLLAQTQSIKEMLYPGLLAVLSPILVTIVFKLLGHYRGENDLGIKVTGSFIVFATTTGILMAFFMNNTGGAFDNAKKGAKSLQKTRKSVQNVTVIGDVVGDPMKDTAGPSIHILIKLISTLSMTFLPLSCYPL